MTIYQHVFIAMVLSLSTAQAIAEEDVIEVEFPPVNGQEQVLTGSREELLNYADQFTQKGNYEFAELCYKTIIVWNTSDVRSRLLLGRLYQFYLRDFARAVSAYKKAEQYIPESQTEQKAYCIRMIAEIYRELADKKKSLVYYAQAISEYEKILRYTPDDVEVQYLLGVARLGSNDYDRAISSFEAVIEKEPRSEWAKGSREAIKIAKSERKK